MSQAESADCDPCAVPTEPLAVVVEQFVSDWERQHPAGLDSLGRVNGGSGALRDGGGRFAGRDPLAPPTAVDVLADRTRALDRRHGVGVPPAEIQRVLERRERLTELRVADAIATAAHRTKAFYDGTLPIRPNPYAPASVRATAAAPCCPGPPPPESLLGVA